MRHVTVIADLHVAQKKSSTVTENLLSNKRKLKAKQEPESLEFVANSQNCILSK